MWLPHLLLTRLKSIMIISGQEPLHVKSYQLTLFVAPIVMMCPYTFLCIILYTINELLIMNNDVLVIATFLNHFCPTCFQLGCKPI